MSDLRDIATLCKEIDYLTKQVDTLRKERDEARREVLEGMHPDLRQGYAAAREWDCYKNGEL